MTRAEALNFAEEMRDKLSYRLECADNVPARSYYEKQWEMLIQAIVALREQEQREWISVKEKFPNKNGFYLVYDKTCNMIGIRNFRVRDGYCQVTWRNDITHWMPLLEPPKED